MTEAVRDAFSEHPTSNATATTVYDADEINRMDRSPARPYLATLTVAPIDP